jgi:hypothetical protein
MMRINSGNATLEEALLKLSRARWPLGRVVAVAENSLRSKGDDEEIAKGLKELKRCWNRTR